MFPKSVFAELLWFLSGSTMNQALEALGCKFWGRWCNEEDPRYIALCKRYGYPNGDFGPIYGFQLRHFGATYVNGLSNYHGQGFDQLIYMLDLLEHDPHSRRNLFSLWNPAQLPMMALPPCHYTYQVLVDGNKTLHGVLTQRSCDFPVGVPANVQFYSTLTRLFARHVGYKVGTFTHNTVDAHIYVNQVDAVEEYLARPKPGSPFFDLGNDKFFGTTMDNFQVFDYNPEPVIVMPVSI
jgi:thymidylate synthase